MHFNNEKYANLLLKHINSRCCRKCFLPPPDANTTFKHHHHHEQQENFVKKLELVMRGLVNVENEAKIGSTVGSSFEALVVWAAVEHCPNSFCACCWG